MQRLTAQNILIKLSLWRDPFNLFSEIFLVAMQGSNLKKCETIFIKQLDVITGCIGTNGKDRSD